MKLSNCLEYRLLAGDDAATALAAALGGLGEPVEERVNCSRAAKES